MGTETTNLSSTQDQTRRVSEQPYLPNSSTMIKTRHALAGTTLTKGFCLSATALLALVGTLVVALLTAQHAQAHDVAAFLEHHAASPFVIGSHHHHLHHLHHHHAGMSPLANDTTIAAAAAVVNATDTAPDAIPREEHLAKPALTLRGRRKLLIGDEPPQGIFEHFPGVHGEAYREEEERKELALAANFSHGNVTKAGGSAKRGHERHGRSERKMRVFPSGEIAFRQPADLSETAPDAVPSLGVGATTGLGSHAVAKHTQGPVPGRVYAPAPKHGRKLQNAKTGRKLTFAAEVEEPWG